MKQKKKQISKKAANLEKNDPAPVLSNDKDLKTLKKRKLDIKKSLQCPYNITWPDIEKNVQTEMLNMIESALKLEDLRKPILPKGIKVDERKPWMKARWDAMTPRVHNLRSQLSIGLSKSLRLLQRDQLAVLLVDIGTPASLNKFTLHTAGVMEAHCLGIKGLSSIAAPLLGLDSVICLGFKKMVEGDEPGFQSVIDNLRPLIPAIEIPWADFEQTTDEIHGDTTAAIANGTIEGAGEVVLGTTEGVAGGDKEASANGTIEGAGGVVVGTTEVVAGGGDREASANGTIEGARGATEVAARGGDGGEAVSNDDAMADIEQKKLNGTAFESMQQDKKEEKEVQGTASKKRKLSEHQPSQVGGVSEKGRVGVTKYEAVNKDSVSFGGGGGDVVKVKNIEPNNSPTSSPPPPPTSTVTPTTSPLVLREQDFRQLYVMKSDAETVASFAEVLDPVEERRREEKSTREDLTTYKIHSTRYPDEGKGDRIIYRQHKLKDRKHDTKRKSFKKAKMK